MENFNVDKLREITNSVRKKEEVEYAEEVFEELQFKAVENARAGMSVAGVTRDQADKLGKHGKYKLKEVAEEVGLTFVERNGNIWVKWQ